MKSRVAFISFALVLVFSALLAKGLATEEPGPGENTERFHIYELSREVTGLTRSVTDTRIFWKNQIKLELPQGDQTLALALSIKNGNVVMRLTNPAQQKLAFYNSLNVDTELPPYAYIQVRSNTGELYDKWPGSPDDKWTPLSLTSSFDQPPVNLQYLNPGQSIERTIAIEAFFFRSDFDFAKPGNQVRIVACVFVDELLEQHVESRTEWVPLELDRSAISSAPFPE